MQVPIAWNNNRTIGGTTMDHCFERFCFIWPFPDPWFDFGAVRRSTNPGFMLNLNGGHPGGGLLDLILDGDVPSRFQKQTRSLYQFFQNVYPTLYQFFKNIYPTLYQFSENAYPILYQLEKLRKSIPFLIPKSWKLIPFLIPKSWKTIPFPMARPRTQIMYSTPPPPRGWSLKEYDNHKKHSAGARNVKARAKRALLLSSFQ